MGYLTIITSGKGGSGKSTISVGLASAFNKKNKKVLLIDLDEGLRCLDLMLGVSDKLVFDLSDILNFNKSVNEVKLKVNKNIDLIAAPAQVNSYKRFDFGKFLKSIINDYDHIIVDCPAGVDVDLYNALPTYAQVFVVESLDMIGCRCASTIENILYDAGILNRFLIINKFDHFLLKKNNIISLDDIVDKTGLMIRGVVPYDSQLSFLSAEGKLFNKSEAFSAFMRIADRIEFKDIPLPKLNNL